eukprot:scaffold6344_cov27-Tisochrysis_lutea.AAC.1
MRASMRARLEIRAFFLRFGRAQLLIRSTTRGQQACTIFRTTRPLVAEETGHWGCVTARSTKARREIAELNTRATPLVAPSSCREDSDGAQS